MSRLAAPLLLLGGAWAATLALPPWSDDSISDLPVYRPLAEAFLDGSLPYRDVPFEYPPLAALAIALPALLGGGPGGYELGFGALMAASAAAVVALTGQLAQRTGGDRGVALAAAALAPLLTGAMIRTHFDLAPVAAMLASLASIASGRPRLGFALLGVGTVIKGFPLVVAPVALAWLVGRGDAAGARRGAVALVATLAASAAAWLALSPGGAHDALRFHLERPVQLESSPASALLALDGLGAASAEVVHEYGSHGLRHPASQLIAALSAAAVAATVGWLALAAARANGDPRRLVLASLAAVTALAALGKVLSPQFLVWVVPLLALALAWRLWALAAALAAALGLTLVEFPGRYLDLVALDPLAVVLVAGRNLVLVAGLALAARAIAVRPTRRAAAAARSTAPGRRLPRRSGRRSATDPPVPSRTSPGASSGTAGAPARASPR